MKHRSYILKALVFSSVLCGAANAAWAGDIFLISNNQILGNSNVFHAEIPPSLTGQALVAEPSQQDIFVVGVLYGNSVGVPVSLGAVRYGRGGDRGEARIVAGPVDLGITIPMGMTAGSFALRGGFARGTMGPILGVVTGTDAKIYLYGARNLAQYIPAASTVNYIDGSTLTPKPTKLTAMIGSGQRLYAADATQPIIMQYDLNSNTASICRVDSQPTGFVDTGTQIQVLTSKGTASIMGDCSTGMLTSSGTVPMPKPATELDLPVRNFNVTERVLEPTMSSAPNMNRHRRGTYVNLSGTTTTTVNITAGTCTARTQFLAGDVFATPTVTTSVQLTTAAPAKALYAEQTYPGEDCYAILSSGTGEALLRVRGSIENLGATAFLLDRSWSMERSFRGVGNPTVPTDQRIAALRDNLISLLGSLTFPLYVQPVGGPPPSATPIITGPWVFMPFTDQAPTAWSTPMSGFTSGYNMSNPDNPGGLRIKGFGTATSDKFDPGGPSDLAQSMRAALTRLAGADTMPVDSTGTQRRLWIMSDNQSGKKSYLDNQTVLPLLQKGNAQLRYFGLGGHGLDPLLQQFVSLATGLGGDRQYGPPRGQAIEVQSPSGMHEALVAATVRDVLRGRPLGSIARGEMNKAANKTLNMSFKLTRDAAMRDDPWLLFIAAWDHADATPQLTVQLSNTTTNLRCFRAPTAMICASQGFSGDWTGALTVDRPGAQSSFGVLRVFTASMGPAGEIGLHTSFARSMYKSGQTVRVQAYLTERGLPLRLATVTAKVFGPNAALGTIAGQAKVAQPDVANLVTSNGDVSPGQAKVELLDPTALPAQKPVALNLKLYDDGINGGDNQTQDGIYQGEFQAFIPGIYTVDIKADYTGLFPNNVGSVEDRVTTNVVTALDQGLTAGSVRSEGITGGIRLRFTPQDAGKNFLGPGQASALMFAQGTKMVTFKLDDFLDGSYRADVTGIDANAAFDLIAPGSRIQVYDPANPNPGQTAEGCSMTTRPQPSALAPLLLMLLACTLFFRRYRLG